MWPRLFLMLRPRVRLDAVQFSLTAAARRRPSPAAPACRSPHEVGRSRIYRAPPLMLHPACLLACRGACVPAWPCLVARPACRLRALPGCSVRVAGNMGGLGEEKVPHESANTRACAQPILSRSSCLPVLACRAFCVPGLRPARLACLVPVPRRPAACLPELGVGWMSHARGRTSRGGPRPRTGDTVRRPIARR